jgi:hypothetical protein
MAVLLPYPLTGAVSAAGSVLDTSASALQAEPARQRWQNS